MDQKKPAPASAEKKMSGREKCMFFFKASVIAGLLFAVVHTILMWTNFDNDAMMFENASKGLMTVFYVICAIFVLALFSLLFITKRMKLKRDDLPEEGTSFSYAVCGFAVAVVTVMSFIFPTVTTAGASSVFSLLYRLMGIPTAVFFFSLLFTGEGMKKTHTVLGFFPIIWLLLQLMYVYFDQTRPIGNPIKVMTQVVLVSLMCYFLLEQRIRVGKPLMRGFFIFASISVFVILLTAVPELIMTFSGRWVASSETMSLVSQLAMGLYVVTRVISLNRRKKTKNPVQTEQ